MNRIIILLVITFVFLGCNEKYQDSNKGIQSQMVIKIIEAVNEKDADKYVENLADDFKVYLDTILRAEGKENFRINRTKQFERFPKIHSEIQHIVEIDNKVILHDKLWLNGKGGKVTDIVEIFTFQDGKIEQMDVIQSKDIYKGQ